MSPINTLTVLGFASAALAVPYHGHGHGHHHGHARPSGYSVFPYPSANGTVIGSTGFATGTAGPTNYAPQPVGPATESAVASSSETTVVEPSTYFNAASGTICTTDVTVTSKVQVTVTVTAEESSSDEIAPTEAPSSSSSSRAKSTQFVTATVTQQHTSSAAPSSTEAAPVESSAAPSSASSSPSSAPAYSAPASSSSSSSSSSQSDLVNPVAQSSTSSESSSAVMPTMTYSEAKKAPAYTSSSSAAPTPSSSYGGSSGSGKRGVAYNDASLTDCFMNNDQITWGYNWGSASDGLSSSVKYIPQLWSGSSPFTDWWSQNAKDAINNGSTHLFSFNEPDLSSQANMSPESAASAYKQYMQPFAGGDTKLCAPAVTNGGGEMGLTWLKNFMDSCSDCQIDCVNVHWYDSAENTEYFQNHVQNATDISGGKPVFVSEFGATGSDDQIGSFLSTVMKWMDGKDFVAGYSYFMVSDGLLVNGGEPSTYGKVYAGSS